MPRAGSEAEAKAVAVLLVDDNAVLRESIGEALVKRGYDVRVVDNGFAAVEALHAHDFDVVLTDLRMPGMTGVELLRTIKHRSPEIAVIVLTGFADLDTAIECMPTTRWPTCYRARSTSPIDSHHSSITSGALRPTACASR